jgi:hypothetical protein
MAAIIAITAKEKPGKPTLTLPLDALSTDGAEPEVGDEIEHSIKGTITSIKGDTATISVKSLDGAPVEGSPEEEAAESPEEEQSEEENEGSSNPGKSNPGKSNPGPGMPGMPAMPTMPPAAMMRPPSPIGSKQRAATRALGASLRSRARGRPLPML